MESGTCYIFRIVITEKMIKSKNKLGSKVAYMLLPVLWGTRASEDRFHLANHTSETTRLHWIFEK